MNGGEWLLIVVYGTFFGIPLLWLIGWFLYEWYCHWLCMKTYYELRHTDKPSLGG
jgi:hypothetical protein